jgi:LPS-assembly lipoprotein
MIRKLLFLLIPIIASCGFKLHGYNPDFIKLSPLKITFNEENPILLGVLKNILKQNHIKYTDSNTNAPRTLVINSLNKNEQLTAVSSSTTPRQYLIILTLKYSLLNAHGRAIIDNASINASRQVTINNDRILGSEMEKNTIENEMLPELCDRMLLNLIKNDFNKTK